MVFTSQRFVPVFASSDTSRPSIVPTYTAPFHTATPRFTASQHRWRPHARGTSGSYFQSSLPVFASSAHTTLHVPVVYIVPSTTIGLACRPRVVAVANDHARPSFSTLPSLTCASGL